MILQKIILSSSIYKKKKILESNFSLQKFLEKIRKFYL